MLAIHTISSPFSFIYIENIIECYKVNFHNTTAFLKALWLTDLNPTVFDLLDTIRQIQDQAP